MIYIYCVLCRLCLVGVKCAAKVYIGIDFYVDTEAKFPTVIYFCTVFNFLSMQYCSIPVPHNRILSPQHYGSYFCYCFAKHLDSTKNVSGIQIMVDTYMFQVFLHTGAKWGQVQCRYVCHSDQFTPGEIRFIFRGGNASSIFSVVFMINAAVIY